MKNKNISVLVFAPVSFIGLVARAWRQLEFTYYCGQSVRKAITVFFAASVTIAGASAMQPSQAQAAQVVSPNANASSEGNSANGFPFSISDFALSSQRYQQVYNAAEFSSITSPMVITQIAFRPNALGAAAFSSTLPSIQIDMSTTSAAADTMNATFGSNVGANDTVVFPQGPLSLSSAFTGPAAGPKDFDIVINFTTPFLYNPSAGNLLLDVRNFGGGSTTQFDAQNLNGDGSSRDYSDIDSNVGGASGTLTSFALVTRFTFTPVPEPSAGILLMVGGFLLAAFRERSRLMAFRWR